MKLSDVLSYFIVSLSGYPLPIIIITSSMISVRTGGKSVSRTPHATAQGVKRNAQRVLTESWGLFPAQRIQQRGKT